MPEQLLTRTDRRLPAPLDVCTRCGGNIVWARTTAGPNGRGGKPQPFDPYEDEAGNVAVYPRIGGQLIARALHKGERVDRPIEYQAMPHVATCTGDPQQAIEVPDNVASISAARARRRTHRRR